MSSSSSSSSSSYAVAVMQPEKRRRLEPPAVPAAAARATSVTDWSSSTNTEVFNFYKDLLDREWPAKSGCISRFPNTCWICGGSLLLQAYCAPVPTDSGSSARRNVGNKGNKGKKKKKKEKKRKMVPFEEGGNRRMFELYLGNRRLSEEVLQNVYGGNEDILYRRSGSGPALLQDPGSWRCLPHNEPEHAMSAADMQDNVLGQLDTTTRNDLNLLLKSGNTLLVNFARHLLYVYSFLFKPSHERCNQFKNALSMMLTRELWNNTTLMMDKNGDDQDILYSLTNSELLLDKILGSTTVTGLDISLPAQSSREQKLYQLFIEHLDEDAPDLGSVEDDSGGEGAGARSSAPSKKKSAQTVHQEECWGGLTDDEWLNGFPPFWIGSNEGNVTTRSYPISLLKEARASTNNDALDPDGNQTGYAKNAIFRNNCIRRLVGEIYAKFLSDFRSKLKTTDSNTRERIIDSHKRLWHYSLERWKEQTLNKLQKPIGLIAAALKKFKDCGIISQVKSLLQSYKGPLIPAIASCQRLISNLDRQNQTSLFARQQHMVQQHGMGHSARAILLEQALAAEDDYLQAVAAKDHSLSTLRSSSSSSSSSSASASSSSSPGGLTQELHSPGNSFLTAREASIHAMTIDRNNLRRARESKSSTSPPKGTESGVSVKPAALPFNVDDEGFYSLAEDDWKVGDPHPNDRALWAVKIKLKVPIFKKAKSGKNKSKYRHETTPVRTVTGVLPNGLDGRIVLIKTLGLRNNEYTTLDAIMRENSGKSFSLEMGNSNLSRTVMLDEDNSIHSPIATREDPGFFFFTIQGLSREDLMRMTPNISDTLNVLRQPAKKVEARAAGVATKEAKYAYKLLEESCGIKWFDSVDRYDSLRRGNFFSGPTLKWNLRDEAAPTTIASLGYRDGDTIDSKSGNVYQGFACSNEGSKSTGAAAKTNNKGAQGMGRRRKTKGKGRGRRGRTGGKKTRRRR